MIGDKIIEIPHSISIIALIGFILVVVSIAWVIEFIDYPTFIRGEIDVFVSHQDCMPEANNSLCGVFIYRGRQCVEGGSALPSSWLSKGVMMHTLIAGPSEADFYGESIALKSGQSGIGFGQSDLRIEVVFKTDLKQIHFFRAAKNVSLNVDNIGAFEVTVLKVELRGETLRVWMAPNGGYSRLLVNNSATGSVAGADVSLITFFTSYFFK